MKLDPLNSETIPVQDPGFFDFYRSMQAYEAALSGESTYMVLSPDSEFFDFFSAVGRVPGE